MKNTKKTNWLWISLAFAFLVIGSFGAYQAFQIPVRKPTKEAQKVTDDPNLASSKEAKKTVADEVNALSQENDAQKTTFDPHLAKKKAFQTFLEAHPYHQPPKMTREEIKAMPKADRPDLAAQLDFLKTIDPNTLTVPRERLGAAREFTKEKLKKRDKAGIPGVAWTERGPNNVGGRTRALMFDPNDNTNKKVWAGGVTGGLWYNNDITSSASTWTRVDDFWSNIAINCIVADPSNAQTFYVGTGEGYEAFTSTITPSSFTLGDGIWKTTNGGTTWTQLNSTKATAAQGNNFSYTIKMVVNSSGHIFAATRGRSDAQGGIMRSTDGGTTWTRVLAPGSGIGITTIANANNSMSDIEIASNGDLYAGSFGSRLFRSTNGGTTWTNITPVTTGQRVEIGLARSTSSTTAGTTLYAMGVNGSDVGWFRKSTDGGGTWSALTIPKYTEQNCVLSGADFTRDQAWYDLIISVKPDNADVVLIGGIDVHGSTDGGASFNLKSYWTGGCGTYVHADIHNIVFRPGNLNEAIIGTDGGVSYSTDAGSGGTSFSDRNNGYNVTQFYACATPNTNGSNRLFAGAQDNGTIMTTTAGNGAGTTVGGGDGAFCFVDQTNSNIAINSFIYNVYRRATNGGTSQGNYSSLVSDQTSGLFINPADYDNTANVLYSAGNSGQYKIITGLEGTPSGQQTVSGVISGQASAFRANAYTANRVFIGTTGGDLFRVDNANNTGTAAATNIGATLPAGYVTSIDIGANDNELLVTMSNYGIKSVHYTNDGGTTWVSKDEAAHGLPDMPVRWGLFNPNNYKQVMIATETGVWSANDITLANPGWEPTNVGLANVRCDMLRYRAIDKTVVLATHGRGLFTTNSFATPSISVTALSPTNNATGIALNANLQMTFSANIAKGTGNIIIKRTADNSVFETIDVTTANVTIAGAVATINPTNDFLSNVGYYVEVASGAFKDLNNINFPGFTGNTTWKFTSLDNTPPTLTSFLPANNATGIAVDGNLSMTFSENVQKGTGDITIRKVSDNSLVQTIAITDANVTINNALVTINPNTDFTASTQYYVEVANGAIKDLGNNNYAGFTGSTTWKFTTGSDMIPPSVVSFSPAHNSTGFPGANNLTITFSEDVKKGGAGKRIVINKLSDNSTVEAIDVTSANITVAGSVVTINPTTDLPPSADLYVEIDNGTFLDLTDNAYTGILGSTTWKFKTDTSTPIEDSYLDRNIKLYPNPVAKQATLEVTQGVVFGEASIRILDMKGTVIMEQKMPQLAEKQELEFSNLPAGKYLVEIKTKQGKAIKTIIKQ